MDSNAGYVDGRNVGEALKPFVEEYSKTTIAYVTELFALNQRAQADASLTQEEKNTFLSTLAEMQQAVMLVGDGSRVVAADAPERLH